MFGARVRGRVVSAVTAVAVARRARLVTNFILGWAWIGFDGLFFQRSESELDGWDGDWKMGVEGSISTSSIALGKFAS